MIILLLVIAILLCAIMGYLLHEYEIMEDSIDTIEYCLNDMNKKNYLDYKDIYIKYKDDSVQRLEKIDKCDWIDLRASEDIELKMGEFKLIPLGVAMKLPKGYEAHVVPRSSTYKNFGIIQTNHCAIIDESYSGSEDYWFYPVYAFRDTVIHKNDRICQFRIMKKMPTINFHEVDHLDSVNRGGHGSTGVQ